MREKLIELHKKASDHTVNHCWNRECDSCTYSEHGEDCCKYLKADFLIANGVTFAEDDNVPIKWIQVTERLPEEDTRVLVWIPDDPRSYTKMDTDRLHEGRWVRWGESITHWMPLPPAPKGE